MDNRTDKSESASNAPIVTNLIISPIILLTFVFLFGFKYILWHIDRRRLYDLSRNIPGPTTIPIIGNAFLLYDPKGGKKVVMQRLKKLMLKYPKILKLWLGSKLVFIISDAKYSDIILNKALNRDDIYEVTKSFLHDSILTTNDDHWRYLRRGHSRIFSQRSLNGFVDVFYRISEDLVEELRKISGKKTENLREVISEYTFKYVNETLVGFEASKSMDTKCIEKLAESLVTISSKRITTYLVFTDFLFNMMPIGQELKKVRGKFLWVYEKVIKRKMEETKKRHEDNSPADQSILDFMLQSSVKISNKIPPYEVLRDALSAFALAGTETSAFTEYHVLIVLGILPNIQEQAYQEVIQAVGSNGNITFTDIPKLKYIERIIKETLRLFPVFSHVTRKIDEDLQLDLNIILPANSAANIALKDIHKNEKYWENPNQFDPDRFLPENFANQPTGSYLPFLVGPRNCIGWKYALMAMTTMIACILRRYKIYSDYASVDEIEDWYNMIDESEIDFKVTVEPRIL